MSLALAAFDPRMQLGNVCCSHWMRMDAGQMGRNQQLAAKFQELRSLASPYVAAACFAWGLAQAEALTTHQQGKLNPDPTPSAKDLGQIPHYVVLRKLMTATA